MGTKIFTPEMKKFIEEHHKGILRKDLCQMLNEEFGTSLSVKTVINYCNNNGIKNGVDYRFGKDNKPYCYWKKGTCSEAFKKNQFKKGNISHNALPVGTETLWKDKYVYVKIAEPDVWKPKHILVWEKYRSEIPDKHCITFLDGDRKNCDINNLKLISQEENAILNRRKLRTDNAELNETAILTARLISKINKRGKNGVKTISGKAD